MTGLTSEQVQERIEQGLVNANENPNTRTYKQIIRENTLTFFNFLNLVLLVLVLCVRSYKNSMFVGIILINILPLQLLRLHEYQISVFSGPQSQYDASVHSPTVQHELLPLQAESNELLQVEVHPELP